MVATIYTAETVPVEISEALADPTTWFHHHLRYIPLPGALYLMRYVVPGKMIIVKAVFVGGPSFYFVPTADDINEDFAALWNDPEFSLEFEKAEEKQSMKKARKPRSLKQLNYLSSKGIYAKR